MHLVLASAPSGAPDSPHASSQAQADAEQAAAGSSPNDAAGATCCDRSAASGSWHGRTLLVAGGKAAFARVSVHPEQEGGIPDASEVEAEAEAARAWVHPEQEGGGLGTPATEVEAEAAPAAQVRPEAEFVAAAAGEGGA